jgi:hypothetical protein
MSKSKLPGVPDLMPMFDTSGSLTRNAPARKILTTELREIMRRLATAEEGLGVAYCKGFADGRESAMQPKRERARQYIRDITEMQESYVMLGEEAAYFKGEHTAAFTPLTLDQIRILPVRKKRPDLPPCNQRREPKP